MKLLSLLLALFIGSTISFAQNKITVSGTVKDAKTGESMIGAMLVIKDLPATGATTNAYGFYSISLIPGKHTLSFQYAGYEQKDTIMDVVQSVILNMEQFPKTTVLKEVEVFSEKSNLNITSSQMSAQKLNVKEISNIPVFFGEKDILKTIQLLPGIQGISEGNSGFYVRGGGADQNLILLDEATVYNPSHLLGFFSIFNSDAVKDITVFKGGIPAEYGGRISSVLDIKTNDGNNKRFGVTGGIGLIASRLTLEGPIKKNKGSFTISARRTYADMFRKLASDAALRNSKIYFYDLNLKANYQITNKDRVFLSGYMGRDVFNYNNKLNSSMGLNWGNATASLRWNHLFNDKLFLNSSFITSNYNYKILLGADVAQFQVKSAIQDFGIKEDFQYFFSTKHKFQFGGNAIAHKFIPGEVTTGTSSLKTTLSLKNTVERKYANEFALYVSDEYTLSKRFTVNYGLRYSLFTALGEGTKFASDATNNGTNTAIFKMNQNNKTYMGLEPRCSAVMVLDESSSLKASYNRINQYLHLLSNTTSETPVDLWIPSSANVKPQIADQLAFGYFRNFKENTYESSVEIYYKNMQNQIDYMNGADLRLNKAEAQLLFGRGWAYGAEFFFKKKFGKLNGWLGYTYSRTLREFDGINNGSPYPAKQDMIHDFSFVGIYEFNPKWTFSATWLFHTGNAVTLPSGKYYINETVINVYSDRNAYRMPPYHRLDVGLTWNKKKTERFESSWNFSIYNAYGRENAYSISFREDPLDARRIQAVQLSLFRFVPSLTYNFKF